MMDSVPEDREYDVAVYGATGFVGALVAAHLAEHAPPGTRIALAGRSRDRLAALRDGLPGGPDWPLVQADAEDPASLAALARAARVVATTVGPYARHGLPLVEACAQAGTHYADLTGEVLFVRRAIDRFDAVARESGARIVHACGYDSIPSDLSVYLLHERAAADGAGGLRDVQLVATARGALSGGTVDSMRGVIDEVRRDPAARRLAADPFALSPDRAAEPDTPQPGRTGIVRAEDGTWLAPFVMASYNTRDRAAQQRAAELGVRARPALHRGDGVRPGSCRGGDGGRGDRRPARVPGRDERRAHPGRPGPGPARPGHRPEP